jgi:succinate dehydrogenase hydrophobic anchor subunit
MEYTQRVTQIKLIFCSITHTHTCLYIKFSKYDVMIKQISSQYSFPSNKITETVTHVIKMLFIQILIDNANAMECISLFCTHIKDQNEIFFHFLVQISNILEKA